MTLSFEKCFSAEIQKKNHFLFLGKSQFAGDFSSNLDEFPLKFSRKGTTPQRVKPTLDFHYVKNIFSFLIFFFEILFLKKNETERLVLPSQEWFLFR